MKSLAGKKQTEEFREIMSSSQRRMFFKHPIMTVKHKIQSLGVDYAKHEVKKRQKAKDKANEKDSK